MSDEREGNSEGNKRLVRRIVDEAYNQGNLAIIEEVAAPDVVSHAAPPGWPAGVEGARQFIAMWRTALPDIHTTIDDQIAEGDRVVSRWTARGTHRGEMMGIPATGKAVTVSGITINRLSGGRVVEDWTVIDQVGLLQQLGALPAPGGTPS
jgi:steroid delta-isomerase-like uncharacterized protein